MIARPEYELPENLRGTILHSILEVKLREVEMMKKKLPADSLRMSLESAPGPRPFAHALLQRMPSVIAEVKRSSPSAGLLRSSFDAVAVGQGYEKSGAAALSVLTEVHHFRGGLEDLARLRWSARLPLLRKDFLVDPYQILESRHAGADAVLLIVALLDSPRLSTLLALTRELGMEALVEVHNEAELGYALDAGASLLGVNSRNLATFEVSLEVALRMAHRIPNNVVAVAESGIQTVADARRLMDAGYRSLLIGERFMRAESPGNALGEFLAGFSRSSRRAS